MLADFWRPLQRYSGTPDGDDHGASQCGRQEDEDY